MNDMTNFDDAPLPETAEDTTDAITTLVGQIESLFEAIKAHNERHEAGLEVDWDWHHRARRRLGFLKGERAALRRHLKVLLAEQWKERAAASAANTEKQAEIAKRASEAKNARAILNNDRNARRNSMTLKVMRQFIRENAPHLMPELEAAITTAREAFDQENPVTAEMRK